MVHCGRRRRGVAAETRFAAVWDLETANSVTDAGNSRVLVPPPFPRSRLECLINGLGTNLVLGHQLRAKTVDLDVVAVPSTGHSGLHETARVEGPWKL